MFRLWWNNGGLVSVYGSSGALTLSDNLSIPSASYFYLAGDSTTDGSWRMSATTSNSMKIEKRVSGSWILASELTF